MIFGVGRNVRLLGAILTHRISQNAVVGLGDSSGVELPFLREQSERTGCFFMVKYAYD